MLKLTLNKVIVFTAFAVAACAAYFSVTGIGKLLAGGGVAILIFASALELGKLVSVSFLYRYQKEVSKSLRAAFTVAVGVLMIITSAGIYGFLTAAYSKASVGVLTQQGELSNIAAQDTILGTNIKFKTDRITQLMAVRVQQEARLDSTIAKTTYGTSRTITAVQQSLQTNDADMKRLQHEVDSLLTVRGSLAASQIKTAVAVQTDSELGPFIYVASALGMELDDVVKWFILLIVLVFDPLAICLVIAYNFLHERDNPSTKVVQSEPSLAHTMTHQVDSSVPEHQIVELMEEAKPKEEAVTFSGMPINEPAIAPSKSLLPYYMDSGFDWANESLWKSDPEAVAFKSHFR